jgi:hypothetical protein
MLLIIYNFLIMLNLMDFAVNYRSEYLGHQIILVQLQ